MTRLHRIVVAGLAAVLLHTTPACSPGKNEATARSPTSAPGLRRGLEAARFRFSPPTLKVSAGTVAVWTNKDVAPHSVTTAGGPGPTVDLPLRAGERVEVRLDAPGTFRYYCTLHPRMTGRIIVGRA